MSRDFYLKTSLVLFTFAGLVHIYRYIAGLELSIGGYLVPLWVSGLLGLVLAMMVYFGSRFK